MIPRLLLLLVLCVPASAQTGPCATVTGPKLPNLVTFAQTSKQTAFQSTETFAADSCPVQEGAITAGTHRLLRFDSVIGNVGQADLTLGYPPDCGNLYEFDACHGHYHVTFATVYRLWTEAGYDDWVLRRNLNESEDSFTNQSVLLGAEANGDLVRSHKQGFCFIDTVRLKGTPEFTRNEFGVRVLTSHFRHCFDNQGLTIGYGDSYGALLDGQWLVIDGIAADWYVIEIHANPKLVLPESDYTDNSSAARIRL